MMREEYKVGNLEYCFRRIREAMQKGARGSISRETMSNTIIHYGKMLAEKELVYESDELLPFAKGIEQ